MTRLLLFLLAIAIEQNAVTSFTPPNTNRVSTQQINRQTSLSMAGMGMGTKKKTGSKGMGKKADKKAGTSFDVAKSLIKYEKRYDELVKEVEKAYSAAEYEDDIDEILTEYLVAARAKPGSSALASDWIPVAQIVVVRPVHGEELDGELDPSVPAAVSYFCREINHAACLASPSTFGSLSRNVVEYSVEPYESFIKYVYDEVIEGKPSSGSIEEGGETVAMTKTKARELLGLEAECNDAALIKQAYKKKMFELHPDRFVNEERTDDDKAASSNNFLNVKVAYEHLTSGVRTVDANGDSKSWYESLGGKSRTEFYGPIELMSLEKAGALCNKAFKSAVAVIDPELTRMFVGRNQNAKR